MAQSIKEIERPLGQDRRPEPGGRRFGMSAKQVVGLVAMLVLVGISGAIAFRDKPFRKVEEIVAVKPAPSPAVQTKPEPTASKPAEPSSLAAARPDGPQIIHVQPTDSGGAAGITVRDPSALGQNLATAHMPDRALIEDSATGPLPIRAADGRRPFDVYARPWSGGRGARVAIVIGGLAVSQTGTQAAIAKLPAEVTLAFAPQGNSIGRWMQEARRRGHEIVMQIPLEPFDYPNVNPGRNTLIVGADADENLKNLRWALSRTTNYTAVMNYMGARFATDASAMEPIIAELGKRGLGYLDDGSTARSVASEIALKEGVPLAIGDTTIDTVQDRGSILKKLDQLEATARAKGFAIGIGSAFNVTVDAVDAWADEAKKRGIEIVPISAVATDPQRR